MNDIPRYEMDVKFKDISLCDLFDDFTIENVINNLRYLEKSIPEGYSHSLSYDYDDIVSLRTWRYETDEELEQRLDKEREKAGRLAESVETKEIEMMKNLAEKYGYVVKELDIDEVKW